MPKYILIKRIRNDQRGKGAFYQLARRHWFGDVKEDFLNGLILHQKIVGDNAPDFFYFCQDA